MPNETSFIEQLDLPLVNKDQAFNKPQNLDNKQRNLLNELVLPTDWLNQLAQTLQYHVNDVDWSVHLHHHLSNCDTIYVEYFQIIYGYLSGQLDDIVSPITNDKQKHFATVLEEGVNNCTGGVLERAQVLVNILYKPTNLDELLCQARTQLVHEFISQYLLETDIHIYNSILFKAKQWLGIKSDISQASPNIEFNDEALKDTFASWMNQHYQFSQWGDLIAQAIENTVFKADSQLDYEGDDFRSYDADHNRLYYQVYDQNRHGRYADYLRAILDTDVNVPVLDTDYNDQGQFVVKGLNWPGIKQAIWQQLLAEGYIYNIEPDPSNEDKATKKQVAVYLEFLKQYDPASLPQFLSKIPLSVASDLPSILKLDFGRLPDDIYSLCEPIKQACQQAPQQDSDYVQKVAFRFHWEASLAKLIHPLQKLKMSADTINNKIHKALKNNAEQCKATNTYLDRFLINNNTEDFQAITSYLITDLSIYDLPQDNLQKSLEIIAHHLLADNKQQFENWLTAADPQSNDSSISRLMIAQHRHAYQTHQAIAKIYDAEQANNLHEYAFKAVVHTQNLEQCLSDNSLLNEVSYDQFVDRYTFMVINNSFLDTIVNFACPSTFKWLITECSLINLWTEVSNRAMQFTDYYYRTNLLPLFEYALVNHNSENELLDMITQRINLDQDTCLFLLDWAALQDRYPVLQQLINHNILPHLFSDSPDEDEDSLSEYERKTDSDPKSNVLKKILEKEDLITLQCFLNKWPLTDKNQSLKALLTGAKSGTVQQFRQLFDAIPTRYELLNDSMLVSELMCSMAKIGSQDKLEFLCQQTSVLDKVRNLTYNHLTTNVSIAADILKVAAQNQHYGIVHYLLTQDFDPTGQTTHELIFPLRRQVYSKLALDYIDSNYEPFNESLRQLINKNQIDPNYDWRRPIQKAIANNDENRFYELLEDNQVKLDAHYGGNCALHTAAYYGNWQYFKAIWDKIKDTNPDLINQPSQWGMDDCQTITPINLIINEGHLHMLKAINNHPDMAKKVKVNHEMDHRPDVYRYAFYTYAHHIADSTHPSAPEMIDELVRLSQYHTGFFESISPWATSILEVESLKHGYPIHFAAMNDSQGGALIHRMAKHVSVNTICLSIQGLNDATALHVAIAQNNAPAVQALLEEGASLLKQDENNRLPIDYLHLPNEPTNQAQQPIIDIISSIMHHSTHLKKFDCFVQFSNKLKVQLNQAVKHCNYSIVDAFINSLDDVSQCCFNISHLQEAKRMANEESQPFNDTDNQALNDIKDLLDRQITAYENGQACSLTEQIARRLT